MEAVIVILITRKKQNKILANQWILIVKKILTLLTLRK
jgi:hypothetical protein